MCNIGEPRGITEVPRDHPVLAYREWRLYTLGVRGIHPGTLYSLYTDNGWSSDWMQATNRIFSESREIRLYGKTGFYACKSPLCLWAMGGYYYRIKGVVALAGTVVSHEKGVRGEWAKPRAFVVKGWTSFSADERKAVSDVAVLLQEKYPDARIFRSTLQMILWKMRQPRTVPRPRRRKKARTEDE